MGVFQNNLMGAAAAAASAGGDNFYSHQIANSVRNSASQDGTLKFTAGTPTSGTTFTMSYWVKRYDNETDSGKLNIFVTGTGGGTYVFWGFKNNNFQAEFTGGTYGDTRLITDAVYRDTSAWYHHVMRFDSTQASASNRLRLYVNGVEPSYSSATVQSAISQDEDWDFINESGVVQAFGGLSGKGHGTEGADLQMAEIVFCDGQSYGPDSFGETKNGVWIPKDPSGLTFGNNGYYLKFESSSDLGNDSSGNNNDFTAANLATHDQMLDSPTFNSDSNGGNFATMNPLSNGSNPVLGEGNLMMDSFNGSDISGSLANFALPPSSGKWYFECFINAPNSGDNYPFIGLTATTYSQSATMGVSQRDLSINLGTGGSEKNETYVGSITTDFTGVSAYADNTVCGVFVDMDARKLWYAKDGVFTNSGNPQNGTNPNYAWTNNVPLLPHFVSFGSYGADSVLNFGQEGTFAGNVTAGGNADVTGYGNFKYDPGDYKALCAGNLPVADEINPSETSDDYPQKLFGTLQYTGNGSERTIDTTFQVDKSWARSTIQGQNWYVLDTNRGYFGASSNNLYWKLNDKGAQATFPQYNFKAQSGSDITITDGTWLNSGGHTQQMWNWRLAGGTTSTNTQGDVNSTVQVDPSGCFSIATYRGGLTGAGSVNVGHGLSKAPSFIIFKGYDNLAGGDGQNWIGSDGLTSWNYFIAIDSNSAQVDKSGNGSMSAPTSTVFSVNNTDGLGSGTIDNIAYSFADCEGYIKSGKYIGNANADGTFIYLGFKPAFFWILHAASGDDPQVWDTSNGSYNPMTKTLSTHNNSAQVDNTNRSVDFLSNGVKIRSSNSNVNSSNAAGIIYLAMAHNPFKYSTAR